MKKILDYRSQVYICQLPQIEQDYLRRKVSRELYKCDIKGNEHKVALESAMSCKVNDLDDLGLRRFYKKFGERVEVLV